jgi:hypothetical protein
MPAHRMDRFWKIENEPVNSRMKAEKAAEKGKENEN